MLRSIIPTLRTATQARAAVPAVAKYSSAKPYVFINKDTKVICQGLTGKQVSSCVQVLPWVEEGGVLQPLLAIAGQRRVVAALFGAGI